MRTLFGKIYTTRQLGNQISTFSAWLVEVLLSTNSSRGSRLKTSKSWQILKTKPCSHLTIVGVQRICKACWVFGVRPGWLQWLSPSYPGTKAPQSACAQLLARPQKLLLFKHRLSPSRRDAWDTAMGVVSTNPDPCPGLQAVCILQKPCFPPPRRPHRLRVMVKTSLSEGRVVSKVVAVNWLQVTGTCRTVCTSLGMPIASRREPTTSNDQLMGFWLWLPNGGD